MSSTALARRLRRALVHLLLGLALWLPPLLQPPAASAGPVDWQLVAETAEGRQWWDRGSLRLSRRGTLTVLSRYQAPPKAEDPPGGTAKGATVKVPAPKAPAADLYVMELDCDQRLFRDTSVNGLPRWGSNWEPLNGDDLVSRTANAVCEAGGELLASR